MNLAQFIALVENNRGKFKKDFTPQFNDIYTNGSEALLNEAINNKKLGIAKLAEIARELSHKDQDHFMEWLNSDRRTIAQVNAQYLTY